MQTHFTTNYIHHTLQPPPIIQCLSPIQTQTDFAIGNHKNSTVSLTGNYIYFYNSCLQNNHNTNVSTIVSPRSRLDIWRVHEVSSSVMARHGNGNF